MNNLEQSFLSGLGVAVAKGKIRVYHATTASKADMLQGIKTSMDMETSHGDVVHVTKIPSYKYGKLIIAADVPIDEVRMQSKSEFRIERPIRAEEIVGTYEGVSSSSKGWQKTKRGALVRKTKKGTKVYKKR